MPWHPTSDWEKWDGLHLWRDTIAGIPLIEKIFTTIFRVAVRGGVEPIALRCDGSDAFFMFAADGRSYLYNDGVLSRCEGEFASKDDFLERKGPWQIVPHQPVFDDVYCDWLPGY
jgi:hypothetical protein